MDCAFNSFKFSRLFLIKAVKSPSIRIMSQLTTQF